MTETKMDNSYDTKTIITVLCLIFVYPIGVIMMWVWMKWSVLVKLLLSAVFVLPLVAVFSVGILATINPAEQKARARDTVYQKDTEEVLNAISSYYTDKKKYPFVLGKDPVYLKTFVDTLITSGKLPADFKSKMVFTSKLETDYIYVDKDEKSGLPQACFNVASGAFAKANGAVKGDDICYGLSDN